jgi:hypothetical protein
MSRPLQPEPVHRRVTVLIETELVTEVYTFTSTDEAGVDLHNLHSHGKADSLTMHLHGIEGFDHQFTRAQLGDWVLATMKDHPAGAYVVATERDGVLDQPYRVE